MSSPAGWYLQPDGQQRYWDGELWTDQFAPGVEDVPSEAGSVRSDIGEAKNRMRHKFGSRRELKRLESYVDADEHVDRILSGLYGKGTGILVLSDRRLIFIKDGAVSKTTEDFALRSVTSVAWHSGMALGTIIITAGGVRAEIKNVNKDDGKELVDLARTRLSAGQVPSHVPVVAGGSPSPLDQLKQLGELRDAGIVTEEEFAAKKVSILAQM
jgi:hypothetical protein